MTGRMMQAGPTRVHLIAGDAIERMYALPAGSVDLIFGDPPYFLSSETGTTCKGGKRTRVHKGEWDEPTTPEQQRAFGVQWLAAARRLLKPSGSIMVSGTSHSIHDVYTAAVAGLGMVAINEIVWSKPNPPPNLACRSLQHASESVLWMRPSPRHRHYFNYARSREVSGVQMRSVWEGILPPGKAERARGGGHPTQKPLALLARCLLIACPPGGVVLDPFNGSGTTTEAGVIFGCAGVLGIDRDPHYIDTAAARVQRICDGISDPPRAVKRARPRAIAAVAPVAPVGPVAPVMGVGA